MSLIDGGDPFVFVYALTSQTTSPYLAAALNSKSASSACPPLLSNACFEVVSEGVRDINSYYLRTRNNTHQISPFSLFPLKNNNTALLFANQDKCNLQLQWKEKGKQMC